MVGVGVCKCGGGWGSGVRGSCPHTPRACQHWCADAAKAWSVVAEQGACTKEAGLRCPGVQGGRRGGGASAAHPNLLGSNPHRSKAVQQRGWPHAAIHRHHKQQAQRVEAETEEVKKKVLRARGGGSDVCWLAGMRENSGDSKESSSRRQRWCGVLPAFAWQLPCPGLLAECGKAQRARVSVPAAARWCPCAASMRTRCTRWPGRAL